MLKVILIILQKVYKLQIDVQINVIGDTSVYKVYIILIKINK